MNYETIRAYLLKNGARELTEKERDSHLSDCTFDGDIEFVEKILENKLILPVYKKNCDIDLLAGKTNQVSISIDSLRPTFEDFLESQYEKFARDLVIPQIEEAHAQRYGVIYSQPELPEYHAVPRTKNDIANLCTTVRKLADIWRTDDVPLRMIRELGVRLKSGCEQYATEIKHAYGK